MNSFRLRNKKGFTLVELSIVLVIIGLLIGGILVGQTLINASKVQAFIRQLQQMDTLVSTFQLKYKSLPGDSMRFTPQGDGNGVITRSSSTTAGDRFSGEIANFWVHLNQAGFEPSKTYSATNATTFNSSKTSPNAPFAVLGDKASFLPYTDAGPNEINMWAISNKEACTGTNISPSQGCAGDPNAFTSIDITAIDQKIDDGIISGRSGNFYGMYVTPLPGSGFHGCTLADEKCFINAKIMYTSGERKR